MFCFVSPLSRAASPSPQSVRRVSSSRSVSGSPEPAAKKPPAPPSPVQSQSPSTNWSPAVPVKKAKSPTPSPSPARVCACLFWASFIIVRGYLKAEKVFCLWWPRGASFLTVQVDFEEARAKGRRLHQQSVRCALPLC